MIEEDLGDYYKIRQSDPGSYLWRKDEILNKNLEKDNKYVPKSDFELHGYTDFQFLPFTSLIFKTFSFYFGKENWKYGLTFFSILSSIIVFIILRSFLSEGYSLIGVLFLNFNPLLNFFFKFPVSESFTFFYFLSLIYSMMCIFKNYNHNFFLLFNSFSISSIFLIRIDAIFYLYNFLIFFSILIFSNKNYRYYFYILFTILLFLLISQVHLNFNEHYVGGIYSHFFRIDILKNPISLLIAIIALFFILERIFFLLPNKLIEKVFDNLNLIIIFFIFLSFLNLLLLMKGISFQKNILVTTERGFQFINYSKLVSIFYYLNLVLFPVILFKSKDIFIRSLFIIFLFWFIWHTLIEPSRGYDFYYSRYLFPNIFLIFQLLFLININIIFKSRLLKTTIII